jgi:hypothetical protein
MNGLLQLVLSAQPWMISKANIPDRDNHHLTKSTNWHCIIMSCKWQNVYYHGQLFVKCIIVYAPLSQIEEESRSDLKIATTIHQLRENCQSLICHNCTSPPELMWSVNWWMNECDVMVSPPDLGLLCIRTKYLNHHLVAVLSSNFWSSCQLGIYPNRESRWVKFMWV